MKFYKVVAVLLYGGESWVTGRWDDQRMKAAEMRC